MSLFNSNQRPNDDGIPFNSTPIWYACDVSVTLSMNEHYPNPVLYGGKVQFNRLAIFFFKKKGGIISRRILPTQIIYTFTSKLVIQFLVDGLALCVFSHVLPPCESSRHDRHRFHSNSACIATNDWLRFLMHFIGIHNAWLAAPALWHHDRDISLQNIVLLPIFQSDIKSQGKCDKKYVILKRKV